jgi:hypothetical protein
MSRRLVLSSLSASAEPFSTTTNGRDRSSGRRKSAPALNGSQTMPICRKWAIPLDGLAREDRDLTLGERRRQQRPEFAPYDDPPNSAVGRRVDRRAITVHPGLFYSQDG